MDMPLPGLFRDKKVGKWKIKLANGATVQLSQ
jgi:hypothetical protein